MSISLKSIELSNLRSHEHLYFEPAETGITAINGPTGAGKSTIVDSIAWALFGTKPQGVSKASAIYRAGADFKTDKCYARLELYVDGSLFKIERRMVAKSGAAEADLWEWENENWVHRAGSAVSHTEKEIKQRLNMDEKGFLTAILVQQKQVDQLISSGPRERAQVIEKLTGIASITAGLVAARQEHNLLRKSASLSTIDEQQLVDVKEELVSETERKKTLGKAYKQQKESIVEKKEEGSALKLKVNEENEKAEALTDARNREVQLENLIEIREETLEETITEKDRLKKLLTHKSSLKSDYDDTKEKLEELKRNIRKKSIDEDKLKTKLENEKKTANSYQKLIDDADFGTLKEVERRVTKLEKRMDSNKSSIKELEASNSQFKSEASQFSKAIKVLSKGDCPTCLQTVEDSDAAISLLQEKVDNAHGALEANTEKIEKLKSDFNDDSLMIDSLDEVKEAFENIFDTEGNVKSLDFDLNELQVHLKVANSELKASEKVFRELEKHEENSRAYNNALAKSKKLIENIDTLKMELKAVVKTIASSGAISASKLNKLRSELFEKQNAYQAEVLELKETKTEARLTNQNIEFLKEKIERYENEITKHKDLLASVEISSATVHILDEFRGNRMKTALPTIESYASELLTRFTDGKFTRLELDEKFNATVLLADGTVRPVGLLSGGELSAASIALRLSVSILLNSSAQSMIILDEVLVSQDSDRSELILSTIKDVCQGQVIMIAHNNAIEGIADKTVELEGS